MNRTIERIIHNPPSHWVGSGFRVKQYFPAELGQAFLERFSPFILLDYQDPYFFSATPFETGVGPHPHRGFETVTFAFAGKIEHRDHVGNRGVIGPGGLQWMTAGAGMLHKEYHETEFSKKDRILHLVQLWVDLPQKHKWTEPAYQAISTKEMGRFRPFEGGYEVVIYAGSAFGVKGPAKTFSPMNIYKILMEKDEEVVLREPEDHNLGLLVLSGALSMGGKELEHADFVLFSNDGDEVRLRATLEHSEVFVLSGKPLHQPIYKQGPFVMSTEEEVLEAQRDYESGGFGSDVF